PARSRQVNLCGELKLFRLNEEARMLRRSLWVVWVGVALGLCCAGYGADGNEPAEAPIPAGAAQLSRLDQLPRLRPTIKTGCVSSYDRTGGNDDGFSGKYS